MHGLSYLDVTVVTKIVFWHSTVSYTSKHKTGSAARQISVSTMKRPFKARRAIERVKDPAAQSCQIPGLVPLASSEAGKIRAIGRYHPIYMLLRSSR